MVVRILKFRGLGDDAAVARATDSIEEGTGWYSNFWALNDPMEGMLRVGGTHVGGVDFGPLLEQKQEIGIFSAAAADAIYEPLMWGHYAAGFKGVALEYEVEAEKCYKVEYVHDLPTTLGPNHTQHGHFLSKGHAWRYEQEVRLFEESADVLRRVGNVVRVVICDPIGDCKNRADMVARIPSLLDYYRRLAQLHQVLCASEVSVARAWLSVTEPPISVKVEPVDNTFSEWLKSLLPRR